MYKNELNSNIKL